MKKLITLLLIVALSVPSDVWADEPSNPPPTPQEQEMLVFACMVLAVGAAIVYGLWRLCKRIPNPNPPPNGGTNGPPVMPPSGTNRPPVRTNPPKLMPGVGIPVVSMEMTNVPVYTIASLNYPDDVQGGIYVYTWAWSVQACSNLPSGEWRSALDVRVFESSSGGQLWAAYQNGSNVYNAYFTNPGAENNFPVDFATLGQPHEFFRLISAD